WTASASLYNTNAIAVVPDNPGIAYAGGDNGSVYRTTNEGASWERVLFAGTNISSIIIDDRNPEIVYAAATTGVYKSINSGNTWVKLAGNTDLGLFQVYALALAPSDHNILYAGTAEGNLFRATNKGEEWSQLNSNFSELNIRTLAVDPTNTNLLYVGTSGSG